MTPFSMQQNNIIKFMSCFYGFTWKIFRHDHVGAAFSPRFHPPLKNKKNNSAKSDENTKKTARSSWKKDPKRHELISHL